jgi:transcriptional regulator with XRE-family HTH domain
MSREDDRFRVTCEVGARLRGLRVRAGRTQAQLAEATGRGWLKTMVSKLETGEYPNPGIAVLADYLRACRASFDDLSEILNEYTSRSTPAELKAGRAVARVIAKLPAEIGTQARKYDVKTTVARRSARQPALSAEERVKRVKNLAAAANRRKRLDLLVKYIETDLGRGFAARERQHLDQIVKKLWGALTSTRGRDPRMRLRRVARAYGDGVVDHTLSEQEVRLVRDRVVELYDKMEATGAFGPLVPAKPYLRPTAYERETRGVSQARLDRQVSVSMGASAASGAIDSRYRTKGERAYWNNWLMSLVSDALDTLPGTPEREQIVEAALATVQDKDLGRKLADLALAGLDRFLRRK